MAIGMKMGRTDPKDKEAATKVYLKCRKFWNQFEKEFGSRECYQLTGVHLDNEEERQQWLAAGGHEKCGTIVEKTAQMLCEYMKKV